MKEYHKINTIFKRDNKGKLLLGEFSLNEFGYLQDNEWIWEEKIDGTNIRVILEYKEVGFCGKTDNAQIPIFLRDKLTSIFAVGSLIKVFDGAKQVCLYGEGFGAKIQKGGGNYNPTGVDFILFDVWIDGWWLKREDVIEIASKLGIQSVPVIGHGTLNEAVEYTKHGFNSKWGNFIAEGLILRPYVELFTRGGHRIITKIKHKDFKEEKMQ